MSDDQSINDVLLQLSVSGFCNKNTYRIVGTVTPIVMSNIFHALGCRCGTGLVSLCLTFVLIVLL